MLSIYTKADGSSDYGVYHYPYYNVSDHPRYGPCRRLHVMAMQLFADKDLGEIEGAYYSAFDEGWTQTLARHLDMGIGEPEAQRGVLQNLLNCQNLLDRRGRSVS